MDILLTAFSELTACYVMYSNLTIHRTVHHSQILMWVAREYFLNIFMSANAAYGPFVKVWQL